MKLPARSGGIAENHHDIGVKFGELCEVLLGKRDHDASTGNGGKQKCKDQKPLHSNLL